jgi:hypothetical protein
MKVEIHNFCTDKVIRIDGHKFEEIQDKPKVIRAMLESALKNPQTNMEWLLENISDYATLTAFEDHGTCGQCGHSGDSIYFDV